jgi:hypothetical protein
MELVMKDEHLRQRMRQHAIEIRKTFSVAAILDRWDDLFREIAPMCNRGRA